MRKFIKTIFNWFSNFGPIIGLLAICLIGIVVWGATQLSTNNTRCQQLCNNNNVFVCDKRKNPLTEKDTIVAVCFDDYEKFVVKTEELLED